MKELKLKGVFRTRDLEKKCGSRAKVLEFVEAYGFSRLTHGMYASPNLDPYAAQIIAASKFYPKVVISGTSALIVHKLTDEHPELIDVDIPRQSSIRNQLLRAHRVSGAKLIGVETVDYFSEKIKVYNIERSLCDAYLKEGESAVFFKALKRYVRLERNKSALIQKFDAQLGSEVLRCLRQELANG